MPGTLVDRVAKLGVPLLTAAFDGVRTWPPANLGERPCEGTVDSLRYLLSHNDYNNPDGIPRKLTQLLTRF